ncbi:hypothetical protein [Tautonia marina]|uniref:hypothetical protein n=1 Tax=Tautonia marina TaxID=2653855 RepID=UPI001F2DE1E1|nr:hypothetical protein [Tautonia marina]
MTSNLIFEYTTEQAIADGILNDAFEAVRPKRLTFPLGRLLITTSALEQLTPEEVNAALARHASCDWGEVSTSDARQNDSAMKHGDRVLSAYPGKAGTFWIITEADRSATTILMPDDY